MTKSMTQPTSPDVRTAQTVEQFRYITFMLAFEGVVTNRDLREYFAVSQVQSSRIIRRYQDEHRGFMERGSGRGEYVPGPRFQCDPAHYEIGGYFQLRWNDSPASWVYKPTIDLTKTNPEIAQVLIRATRQGCAADVVYRSMNHPCGKERRLFPHAFAYAGRRWHMRALDEELGEFRDFNIARVVKAQLAPQSNAPDIVDSEWAQWVEVTIKAHPDLNGDQVTMIRDEYFRGRAGRVIRVREAMLNYVLRELEVADDPSSQHPPEYQLAVSSKKPVA